jgi:hypothetical protein
LENKKALSGKILVGFDGKRDLHDKRQEDVCLPPKALCH